MSRTFCALVRDPLADAVLAPFGAIMARARHWQFRELHIRGRAKLTVRKAAQARFGLTKRHALANEFDLDQAVNTWRGTLEHRRQSLSDRLEAVGDRVARLDRQIADPKTSDRKRHQKEFTRHHKKRHIGMLQAALIQVNHDLRGAPQVCFGGRALLRDGETEAWRVKRSSRFLLVGSKDESGGNQTCQYDPVKSTLTLRPPDAVVEELRAEHGDRFDRHGRIVLDGVRFRYGQDRVAAAVDRGVALTWLLFRDEHDRWHAHVSFDEDPAEVVTDLRIACLGVDLNVDHLAIVVADRFGNPIDRLRLPFPEAGTEAGVAAAMIGDAARDLCALALKHGAGVAVEKLDFGRKKAALKEYGRKHARRLSSFAYKAFYEALAARCAREGIDLHAVNPAFTSVIGGLKYATGRAMTRHEAAALVIARRAQGFGERLVCMLDGTLDAPGRMRARHVFSRWRAAGRRLSAEGNGAVRPRRSAGGTRRTGAASDGKPSSNAEPAQRTRSRRAERTGSGSQQVGGAVALASHA